MFLVPLVPTRGTTTFNISTEISCTISQNSKGSLAAARTATTLIGYTPDTGDQAVNETGVAMVPLLITLGYLFRVFASYKLPVNIEHERPGQQQGDEAGNAEHCSEERFPNQ